MPQQLNEFLVSAIRVSTGGEAAILQMLLRDEQFVYLKDDISEGAEITQLIARILENTAVVFFVQLLDKNYTTLLLFYALDSDVVQFICSKYAQEVLDVKGLSTEQLLQ